MEISLLITWIYFAVYCTLFLITSIWAAIIVKEEYKKDKSSNNKDIELQTKPQQQSSSNKSAHITNVDESTDNTSNEIETKTEKRRGCKHYFKKWLKLSWSKKRIYVSIAPHLFDQATDVGVIVQYYQYTFIDTEAIDNDALKPLYWFYLSIVILVVHRLVSSLGVYLLTRNWFNVLLQSMDILMIRCVWTSYKLGRDEPSTTQKYLALLEATFEAMPQLILSAVWFTKTGQFDIIIVISFISSLISLTARVASDDKIIFEKEWHSLNFSYKSCPMMNWRYIIRVLLRFMEISSRVGLLTLMWVNLGGFATGIIIGVEMVWLMIICVGIGSVGNMGNLMYLILDENDHGDSVCFGLWTAFIAYRFLFCYIYLILVTCFANIRFEAAEIDDYDNRYSNTMSAGSIGFYLFVYCWTAHCLWPCCAAIIAIVGTKSFEATAKSTGRDFANLYQQQDYVGIIELCEFGKKLSEEDLKILKILSRGEKKRDRYADVPLFVQEQAAKFVVKSSN
eukprot:129312_1